MSELKVRMFCDGDEDALSRLRKQAYQNYAGVLRPDAELWRWLCVDRPRVTSSNVLVSQLDHKPCGYCAVGTDARVYDFVIDPSLSRAERREIADRLVLAAEEHLLTLGQEEIHFSIPEDDRAITSALRKRGYRVTNPAKFVICAVDVPRFLSYLTKEKRLGRRALWKKGVRVELVRGKYIFWDEDVRKYTFDGEKWTDSATAEARISVEMKMVDFLQLMQGNLKPLLAILSKTIRVHPAWRIFAGLRVVRDLIVDLKWYRPITDEL